VSSFRGEDGEETRKINASFVGDTDRVPQPNDGGRPLLSGLRRLQRPIVSDILKQFALCNYRLHAFRWMNFDG
jgi:hypothetical protein